jgi:hypothetical protein
MITYFFVFGLLILAILYRPMKNLALTATIACAVPLYILLLIPDIRPFLVERPMVIMGLRSKDQDKIIVSDVGYKHMIEQLQRSEIPPVSPIPSTPPTNCWLVPNTLVIWKGLGNETLLKVTVQNRYSLMTVKQDEVTLLKNESVTACPVSRLYNKG